MKKKIILAFFLLHFSFAAHSASKYYILNEPLEHTVRANSIINSFNALLFITSTAQSFVLHASSGSLLLAAGNQVYTIFSAKSVIEFSMDFKKKWDHYQILKNFFEMNEGLKSIHAFSRTSELQVGVKSTLNVASFIVAEVDESAAAPELLNGASWIEVQDAESVCMVFEVQIGNEKMQLLKITLADWLKGVELPESVVKEFESKLSSFKRSFSVYQRVVRNAKVLKDLSVSLSLHGADQFVELGVIAQGEDVIKLVKGSKSTQFKNSYLPSFMPRLPVFVGGQSTRRISLKKVLEQPASSICDIFLGRAIVAGSSE